MTSRIERLARTVSLFGSVALLGVLFEAMVAGSRDIGQGKSGYVRVLWSRQVLLPAFFAFFGWLRLMWKPLPPRLPSRYQSLFAGAGLISFVIGSVLIVWGRLALGRMMGLSTAVESPLHKSRELVTTGPYSIVRHPMYLGEFLTALGLLLIWRNWTGAILSVIAPTLIFRAKREEEVLAHHFGGKWRSYSSQVPMLFPDLLGFMRALFSRCRLFGASRG